MRIDAHISLWQQAPPEAAADPRFPGADRDFTPAHLEPILARNRFDGAILFSAGASAAETAMLASWCAASPWLMGISARWPSVASSTAPPQHVEELLGSGVLRGVWSHPSDPNLREAACFCDAHHLALDLLPEENPHFAQTLERLARDFPRAPFVLAHAASPPLASEALRVWREQMRQLAACPNVHCKLSALWSSSLDAWNVATLQSLFTFLVETFGEHRLLFGSDWPYCLPAHSWKETLARFTQTIGPRTMEFREEILGNTAARVYGVSDPSKA